MDKQQKEKEKERHKSRIIWVEYLGDVYWTQSLLSHREWLEKDFGVTGNYDFSQINRGYIRKDEKTEKVHIVSYKGTDFQPAFLKELTVNRLKWIADLYLNASETDLLWFAGLEMGEVGEVWKPLVECEVRNKEQPKPFKHIDSQLVSLNELIRYEQGLLNIIRKDLANNIITMDKVKKERQVIIGWIKEFDSKTYTSFNTALRRAQLYNLEWLDEESSVDYISIIRTREAFMLKN